MADRDKKTEITDIIEEIRCLKETARADRAEYIKGIIEKTDPGKDTKICFHKPTGAVHIVRKTEVGISNTIGRQVLIGECNFFNRTAANPGIVFFIGYDEDGDFGEYLFCSTTVFAFEAALPEQAISASIQRLNAAEKEFYLVSGFVKNSDVYNNEVLGDWDLY